MLPILFTILFFYVKNVIGISDFFNENKRAKLFELTDNKVSQFKINLPEDEFQLLKERANINNDENNSSNHTLFDLTTNSMKNLCNNDNNINKENVTFNPSDFEDILHKHFQEECNYAIGVLLLMKTYNIKFLYPNINFDNEFPELEVNDLGRIKCDEDDVFENFVFNRTDYELITNPYSEKVRFIALQSNTKYNLLKLFRTLAENLTYRHYLLCNDVAQYLAEYKFLEEDTSSGGLIDVNVNSYNNFCHVIYSKEYSTDKLYEYLNEMFQEELIKIYSILEEIINMNFGELYPDVDIFEAFPELNINEDGYPDIDIDEIINGFEYHEEDYELFIKSKIDIDTYWKLEYVIFKSSNDFNLSNLLIKMAKKMDIENADISNAMFDILYEFQSLYINNDGIYHYHKTNYDNESTSNEKEYNHDFKTKNATLSVNIDGKEETFNKVTFSISGKFSRYFSKPQYKLKIRGKKNLYGRTQLKLRSDTLEPTFLRSKLVSDIHNYLETPSTSANYITLYINDEYMGLYLLTDLYKPSWVEFEYGEKNTTSLYKCSHSKLTSDKCECINENDDITDDSEWKDFIKSLDQAKSISDVEDILDVDQFLTEMAIDFLTAGWDHIQASHNYSMFKPRNGKWMYLSFDYDLDLSGHLMYPIYRFEDYTKPIHILEVLILKDSTRFDNIVKDIITRVFNPNILFPRIDELKDLIRPYIEKEYIKDENGNYPGRINHSDWDLYSYEIWDANSEFTSYDNPQWDYVFGIKYWILERYRFLCSYYMMECDPYYMDPNFKYEINEDIEYKGNYIKSDFAIQYEEYRDSGRCGVSFYNIKCRFDESCNQDDFCQESDSLCTLKNGCQPDFGKCN